MESYTLINFSELRRNSNTRISCYFRDWMVERHMTLEKLKLRLGSIEVAAMCNLVKQGSNNFFSFRNIIKCDQFNQIQWLQIHIDFPAELWPRYRVR